MSRLIKTGTGTRLKDDSWLTMILVQSIAATMFILICQASAFGQMGSLSAYSDSWASDDGTIFSSGVTADSYNSYGHTYWTVTTLTSPSGRNSSATSSQSSGYGAYTRAETSLTGDWDNLDPGDYQTESDHWMCCPYMGGNPFSPTQPSQGCFPSSRTFLTVNKGASVTCLPLHFITLDECIYDKMDPCDVKCPRDRITVARIAIPDTRCLGYAQEIRIWVKDPRTGTVICPGSGLTRFSDTMCFQCQELEVVQ